VFYKNTQKDGLGKEKEIAVHPGTVLSL